MDKYKIDSHKLMYHVQRVSDWLGGEEVYPIYMEASPSGACNHRCVFCGLDFMEYEAKFLRTDIFLQRIEELGRLGLKSIMHGGEGEPLLHRNFVDFLQKATQSGIDNAITTNGVLLTPENGEKILPETEWIKVSINAGTRDSYSQVHRTKPKDFDTVIRNITSAVKLKRENNYSCTIGMQMILLPDNRNEAVTLASIARDIGADYLVIKPYSQHPQSITKEFSSVSYVDDLELSHELENLNTHNFNVIFRAKAMEKWDDAEHPYKCCLALPFWSYIDASGNVWGCSMFISDDRFLYGNIYENTFAEIWEGPQRKKSMEFVKNELNVSQCRVNCRMDEINRYLWELHNPPKHVNFI